MPAKKVNTKTTKVENENENEIIEEVNNEEKEVQVNKKEKKVFGQAEGVMCRSVMHGELFFQGAKTGMLYQFFDYGDESEIEYRDLATAVRSKSRFVFDPCFIVEDEDFLEEFPNLKKFYADQYSVKDLKGILKLDKEDMIATINNLPKGAMDNMKTIVVNQMRNGSLYDIHKIRALDEIFGTELLLMSED